MILQICLFITPLNIFAEDSDEEYIELTVRQQNYINQRIKNDRLLHTSTYTTYDTFAQAYFDNLIYNYGNNVKGSCGYVGINMLLSYYDTFLNDTIIPEQYDVATVESKSSILRLAKSPGTRKELPSEDDVKNAFTYSSFINDQKDSSLHAKLISIGMSKLYYNYLNADSPAAVSFGGIVNILNSYLTDIAGLESSDYSIDKIYPSYWFLSNDQKQEASNNVRNFTIEKVKNGIPVMLYLRNNESGHIVIAYDYDENSDVIYCHFGWGSDATHVNPETIIEDLGLEDQFGTNFNIYRAALAINFNIEHSHSSNYVDTEGNTYCSCYFSCHPEHVCTYALCEDDDSKHVYTCNCQYKSDNTGDHSLVYVSQGASYHIQRCRLCGWTSEPSSHYWQSSSLDDCVKCKLCGYLKRLNGEFIPIIKSKKTEIQPAYAFADTE